MLQKAFISSGVSYHYDLVQPGGPLHDFEVLDLGRLHEVNLNAYSLILVPRSADGETLYTRRHQIARYLDHGGVLIALGELWADWFPGCRWDGECYEDTLAPQIVSDHPLVAGYSSADLHWHPAKERWCCHGHLTAPPGAEVLVRNTRGDPWLYIDRTSTNGVILASSNLDPDTHAFHGSTVAHSFFDRLFAWAEGEAASGAAAAPPGNPGASPASIRECISSAPSTPTPSSRPRSRSCRSGNWALPTCTTTPRSGCPARATRPNWSATGPNWASI